MSNYLDTMQQDYTNRILNELLDSESFEDFRDFYLRTGIALQNFRLIQEKNVRDNYKLYEIKSLKPSEYADRFAISFKDEGYKAVTILKPLIRDAQNRKDLKPYDRVGLILNGIKTSGLKVINHRELRSIMETMLMDWTIRDLKKLPDVPMIDDFETSLNKMMIKKNEYGKLNWRQLWSTAMTHHRPASLDQRDREIAITTCKTRNKLRSELDVGEQLLYSRLFKNGFMYNRFSSFTLDNYLEQSYILNSDSKTFDKQFFAEWLSGKNWKSERNKEKFELFRATHLEKWYNIVDKIASQDITYLLPSRNREQYSEEEYDTDLKNGVKIDYTDTQKFINPVSDLDGLRKRVTISSIKNNPTLYLYRSMCTNVDQTELRNEIIKQSPDLISGLDLVESLIIELEGTPNLNDVNNWFKHAKMFEYLMNSKQSEVSLELPSLLVPTERDYGV